jgi:hypothetical protein
LISSGKYTGKLQLAGKRLPFSGQFGLDGKATNAVPRPGTNTLSMELTLDSDQVHGEVSDSVAGWEAELMGDRAPVYTGTSTSPYAGNYTLPGDRRRTNRMKRAWLSPNQTLRSGLASAR